MIDRQRRAVQGQPAIEQVAQRLRGRVGIRGDPGQVARYRPVECDRIEAVPTADVAPHVSSEVGRDVRQINRRVAARPGGWTAPAADDVVIAQHEAVAVQQSNAEGPRILYTVVGDPYRLSQEP